MTVQISSLEELCSILGRAYWVESQLELSIQWEAYMVVKNKYRDVLFTISHESEIHKSLVKKMASKIEGFVLEEAIREFKEKVFNPRGLHDEEILAEILNKELLALDIYTRLHSYTGHDFIKKVWMGKNHETYFSNLGWLIKQEKNHIELLKPFTGKMERIL